jgi:hypothetical protein
VAVGDLTTIDKVKPLVRLDAADPVDDAYLEQLVAASSEWMRTEIGRDILVADYTHTFRGDGEHGVSLPQYPVKSVTSVTVDGLPLTKGVDWEQAGDRVEMLFQRLPRGAKVAISYRAGFDAVPSDLAQAVTEHVALRFRDRDWGAATMRIQGGDLVDHRGDAASGSWAFIRGVIAKYQRVRL